MGGKGNMRLTFKEGEIVRIQARYFNEPIVAKVIKISDDELILCYQFKVKFCFELKDNLPYKENRVSADSLSVLHLDPQLVYAWRYAIVDDISNEFITPCNSAKYLDGSNINKYGADGFCKAEESI